MKNADKIINALREVFPGHAVEYQYKPISKVNSIFIDRVYIGNFDLGFSEQDFDNPEIEIKIKAPKNKITAFVNNYNLYKDDIHEAVERGFKEWEEGSARNN